MIRNNISTFLNTTISIKTGVYHNSSLLQFEKIFKYEVTISLLSLKCMFCLNPWSLGLI